MAGLRTFAFVVFVTSAFALPASLAASVAPSATIFNQACALVGFGLVMMTLTRASSEPALHQLRRAMPLALPLALVMTATLAAAGTSQLPAGLALAMAGTVGAALLCMMAGGIAGSDASLRDGTYSALLVTALIGVAIALVQVFAPGWTDGAWIAHPTTPGRAIGNVRQPNQLATLLLWGAAALVALSTPSAGAVRGQWQRLAPWPAMALLMLAVMLTGSRTGMVGVAILFAWGLLDRRMAGSLRALLLAAPLLYALAWWLVGLWSASQGGPAIGAAQRTDVQNLTTGRWLVWRDTLALILAQPVLGVGPGNFNLAWTLTPSPARWPEFFDHSHNLPLQLLVELGVPLGLMVLGLLCLALVRAWQHTRADAGDPTFGFAGVVMLVLMGLHSLLEYPLWYAHFLLPTAFIWGMCLGASKAGFLAAPTWTVWPRWLLLAGATLVVGGSLVLWDYRRVSAIFAPSDGDERALVERIRSGQRSWLFAHHADYALITWPGAVAPPSTADFARAKHYLLDTRLLIAWARAYVREGDVERARWIADRLRELKQPSAQPFFALCDDSEVIDKPFQCTPSSHDFAWRDFVQTRGGE
jgi:O-antigen ligase